MDRLEQLLEQWAWDGPKTPESPQCLDIDTILTIIDHPEHVRPEDWRHLEVCRFCLRTILLVRRDRSIIEAPLTDDEAPLAHSGASKQVRQAGRGTPVAREAHRPHIWARAGRGIVGVAAVLILAFGVTWWAVRGPGARRSTASGLIVAMTGRYLPPSSTRGPGEPEPTGQVYELQVTLGEEAELMGLYLDTSRKLKPVEAQVPTEDDRQTNRRRFQVEITPEDPPGTQWIGVIASEQALDPNSLRAELQAQANGVPDGAPLTAVMDRLDADLQARPGLVFKPHRFRVPGQPAEP